ncbi:hypothetical protein F5Y04DRAFT_289712 [Hypomontagnella monticulosa]|nr:hypothetical protein F5Y04DRAFT_289712 [Hypomontagnella monticulosa]
MEVDETPIYNDGNWTFLYVILGLIPIAFISIAIFSLARDRITQSQNSNGDIEMVAVTSNPPRYWREWFAEPEEQTPNRNPRKGAKVPGGGEPSARPGKGKINRSPPGFEEIPL